MLLRKPGLALLLPLLNLVSFCSAQTTGDPYCAVSDSSLSSDSTGNRGLEYGIWNSSTVNSNTRDQEAGFPNYPVTSFDGTTAVHIGVTNRVGVSQAAGTRDSGSVISIYSDTNLKFYSAFITIIHRGYLYARTSGTYSFTVPYADDIVLVWLGANAVSGFTRDNANIVYATSSNPTSVTITYNLDAGQYLPVRIQYDNAEGGATLNLTVTDPNGNQLLSSTSATDFYYTTCAGQTSNGAAIPQFSPWSGLASTYTTITSTATDNAQTDTQTTTLADPSSTVVGTVEIIIPPQYTTITGPYTGTDPQPATFTSTIASPANGSPGTVEIFTPASYNTITSAYGGATTLTSTLIQPSSGGPGTVVVLVPQTFVTITSLYSGAAISTSTIASASATTPGTVEIFVPSSYVTLTQSYTGTSYIRGAATTTVATQSGTTAGTVIVYTQATCPAVTSTVIGPNQCVCRPRNC